MQPIPFHSSFSCWSIPTFAKQVPGSWWFLTDAWPRTDSPLFVLAALNGADAILEFDTLTHSSSFEEAHAYSENVVGSHVTRLYEPMCAEYGKCRMSYYPSPSHCNYPNSYLPWLRRGLYRQVQHNHRQVTDTIELVPMRYFRRRGYRRIGVRRTRVSRSLLRIRRRIRARYRRRYRTRY